MKKKKKQQYQSPAFRQKIRNKYEHFYKPKNFIFFKPEHKEERRQDSGKILVIFNFVIQLLPLECYSTVTAYFHSVFCHPRQVIEILLGFIF